MGIEAAAVDDLHHLTGLFHGAIPLQLRLRLRPGLLGRSPAGERVVWGDVAGDLRGNDEADLAPPEIRKRDDGVAAVGLVGEAACPFAGVEFAGREPQVAVPLHRVHREVEMGVYRKHRFVFLR